MKTCLLKFTLAMFLAPLLPASAQPILTNRNLAYAGFVDLAGRPQSLVLDFARPAAAMGARPVLIWVHGGGLQSGPKSIRRAWHVVRRASRGHDVRERRRARDAGGWRARGLHRHGHERAVRGIL